MQNPTTLKFEIEGNGTIFSKSVAFSDYIAKVGAVVYDNPIHPMHIIGDVTLRLKVEDIHMAGHAIEHTISLLEDLRKSIYTEVRP